MNLRNRSARGRTTAWTAALAVCLALATPARSDTVPMAAQGCLGCHGPNGAGGGGVPVLAGRDGSELAAIMASFRANERPATIMNRIVRGYTEAEITSVLAYFAAIR